MTSPSPPAQAGVDPSAREMPSGLPHTSDRPHYAWAILAVATFVVFGALGLARFGYTLVLAPMQADLGLDNTQAGGLATANLAGYLALSLLGGALASRYGPRVVISAGLAIAGVAMLLTGAASGFAGAAAWRALTGVGSGASNVPVMGLLSAWFGRRRRGLAAGVAVSGSSVALIVLGPLAPRILVEYGADGWRACWVAYGLATLVVAVVAGLLLRNRPAEMGLAPLGAEEEDAAGAAGPVGSAAGLPAVAAGERLPGARVAAGATDTVSGTARAVLPDADATIPATGGPLLTAGATAAAYGADATDPPAGTTGDMLTAAMEQSAAGTVRTAPSPAVEPSPAGVAAPAGTAPAWGDVYRSPGLWHLGLVYVAFGFSYIMYMTFFTKCLTTVGGYTQPEAGRLFMVMGWFSLLCGLIWGALSDRIGRKRALVMVYLVHTVAFGLFALWPVPSGFTLSAILFGLSAWSIPAIMAAACGDAVGPRLAPAAPGFITLFFGIGQALGPSVAGAMADAAGGSLQPAMLLAAGVALMGAVGAATLRPAVAPRSAGVVE